MTTIDHEKFANTVLYLLRGCRPVRPSMTSLLKMLYYADHDHYRTYLSPITGAAYVALERGPVVDGYKEHFASLETALIVKKHEASIQGRTDKKVEYLPQKEPNEAAFTDTEIQVLDSVIAKHGRSTGVDLSSKTHLEGPWVFAWDPGHPGNPIPYSLFRWLDNLPDEADREEADRVLSDPAIAARVAALNGLAAA